MSVPVYQTIMLPLLELLGDRQEHSLRESIDSLASRFKLSPEQRKELLPSGRQAVFDNRVGWARTYMKKAGYIESTKRGFFRITESGLEVLKQNPKVINIKFLDQSSQFQEFLNISRKKQTSGVSEVGSELTPEETLAKVYDSLRNTLANDLLERLKSGSSSLFEDIVLDLLIAMGYGGSRRDAAEAIGRAGDEGIDGIIKEDRLGLDAVYIQAKKWDNTTVGRPEIQKFAGALQGQRAKKGIFITTSSFSREADEFASNIDNRIILLDGKKLVQLMIDHNVGVSLHTKYEVKKIDSDYFNEE